MKFVRNEWKICRNKSYFGESLRELNRVYSVCSQWNLSYTYPFIPHRQTSTCARLILWIHESLRALHMKYYIIVLVGLLHDFLNYPVPHISIPHMRIILHKPYSLPLPKINNKPHNNLRHCQATGAANGPKCTVMGESQLQLINEVRVTADF